MGLRLDSFKSWLRTLLDDGQVLKRRTATSTSNSCSPAPAPDPTTPGRVFKRRALAVPGE